MSAPSETPVTNSPPAAPPPTGGPDPNAQTPPKQDAAPESKATPGVFDGLPPEIRGAPSLTKFNSVESLAKSYLELETKIGAKGIIPPGKDATPEQVAAFHEALGTPKEPGAYSIAKEFKPPEGLPWNPKLVSELLPVFKKIGVTDSQATELANAYAQVQAGAFREAMTESAQSREQAETALHREWGNAYDAKISAAQRAYRALAGKYANEAGALLLADGTPLAEHPLMKRIFSVAGERMAEDPLMGEAARRMTMTPEEATEQLRKLETDPENAKILLDKMHPDHEAMLARRSALYRAKSAK